ncbi:MAG: ion transporter [Methanoregula sp.]|jgi:voltage-gated potassium channel
MEEPPEGSPAGKYFNYFMIFIIVLNVLVVILETVQPVHAQFFWEFSVIDLVSVIIFTIEYILRLWVCVLHREFKNPFSGRIRYALTPFAIIDLLAIAPFYLPMFMPIDLRFLRILRLFRIIRVLKLGRYSEATTAFHRVLVKKKEELILTFSILGIAIVLSSSLMYYAEHDVQPEAFASIPHAMWWALVTLATVGYGDVYPITPLGKLLGGIVVIIGIAIFALPSAIFASGFIEDYHHRKRIVCPACGSVINIENIPEVTAPEDNKEKPEN